MRSSNPLARRKNPSTERYKATNLDMILVAMPIAGPGVVNVTPSQTLSLVDAKLMTIASYLVTSSTRAVDDYATRECILTRITGNFGDM